MTPHPGQEQKGLVTDVAATVIGGGLVEVGKAAVGKVLGGSGQEQPPAPPKRP
jgi:hypothetical protein